MAAWLNDFWTGLSNDFQFPGGVETGQVVGRVVVAAALGALLGSERAHRGKAAGMRTHAIVSLAAAFFVLAPHQAGMSSDSLSRIIQGVAAGVGFLGAGTILKQQDGRKVRGLTTAGSLYLATAIGIAAGLGRELVAALCTGAALLVLSFLPSGDDSSVEGS